MQERVKVKGHLVGAEVCARHDVRLFDPARCRYKDIINDVKFASILDLFLFLQMQIATYLEVQLMDDAAQDSVLRFRVSIKSASFMIFALQLLFMVIFNCDRVII